MAATAPTEALRDQREPFCKVHKDALVVKYQQLHPDEDITIEESLATETREYLILHPWNAMGSKSVFDHKQWINMFSGTGSEREATASFIEIFSQFLRSNEIRAWLKEAKLDSRGNLVMAVFAH